MFVAFALTLKLLRSPTLHAASEEQEGHLLGFGDPSHKPSTLQRITARRLEVALEATDELPEREFSSIDVVAKLREPGLSVAAEFKRASPSKGVIAGDADVVEVAREYKEAGAALISVLTEPEWFQGSLEDLRTARRAVEGENRPAILRKDFIVHERQVKEA